MKIIDSHCHCHYFVDNFIEKTCKIGFLLNVSTKGNDSLIGLMNLINQNVLQRFDNKFFFYNHHTYKNYWGYSVGYHPQETTTVSFDILLNMAENAMAIGEIGFDIADHSPSINHQIKNFITQMEVAVRTNLPVLIHCRDGWDYFFEYTKNYKKHPFIIHCFTGDRLIAQKLINEYNCLISISGVVTYNNAEAIRDAVKTIPLNRLLVETDSPYLTPFNFRKSGNKENTPNCIIETIEKLSLLKNVSIQEIINCTTGNFCTFFNLPHLIKNFLLQ